MSPSRFIPVLFFISGATALIGEVVWMRMLGLVLGNTVWAASAAVSVWMAGMALGAFIGARLAPRVSRHIMWYGLAEGLIGLFFGLSPWLGDLLVALGAGLGEDLGGGLLVGIGQRFVLATLALLPPTVLMGVTLPLLVERLRGMGLAGRAGLLYGVNTLGAGCGVLSAAYFTLPILGESGSLALAAVLCAVVALVAVLAERWVPAAEIAFEVPPAAPVQSTFLLLAGIMGFASLAAELVWVRLLVLQLGSRVYAFAVLLGVYLAGLGLGAMAVRRLGYRVADPARALSRVQAVTAVMLALQVVALGFAGDLYAGLTTIVQLRLTFFNHQLIILLGTAVLFLPVTVLFGASFPLAVAAEPGRRTAGGHAGAVAAANTVGAILGAVAAPFLLIPLIGSQATLLTLVVVHAGVALWLRRDVLAPMVAVGGVTVAVVIAVFLSPDWLLSRLAYVSHKTHETLLLEEDLGATVLVRRYSEPAGSWYSLELNGVNVAGSTPSLLAIQQLQGQLPLLQHPDPNRVAHIGFGSGGTCWAVSCHPVEAIHVIEISPRVLTASHRWFAGINHHVLEDPRVRVIVNDGRNYLLATETTYDVILSDSIHPVYAGNGALYTLEFFELCRSRLGPSGVVSMWLPLYSLDQESYLRILSAFCRVFPGTAVWYDRTTTNEFTVVTGTLDPGPLRLRWPALERPELAESLSGAGVFSATDVAANLLLGPAEVAALVAGIPPHEDDLPFVEYTAGRSQSRSLTWLQNLALLTSARATRNPFGPDAPVDWDRAVVERDRELRRSLEELEGLVARGDIF